MNPCDEGDEPSEHFDFVYDATTRLATVVPKTQRGETTEQILGLNRGEGEKGLRAHRSRQVARALVLRRIAAGGDAEAAALVAALEARVSDGREEYAAFLRANL